MNNQNAEILNISKIAQKLNLTEDDIELYGKYMAKINKINFSPRGKLILVTSINPTPSGEGKTTVSIGLADALSLLGKKVVLALREPSLGPVFGIKGGATGGGKATIEPSDNINLHFTGDFHAITSANNLLCALIDNHIFQGNELNINPEKIVFHRCLDVNDRALREITINEEPLKRNVVRKEKFDITAASEIMAILCLSSSLEDLKNRLGNILVAYNYDNKPIFAKDIHAQDAITILLKDAIKPNLVQTLKGTPAIVHGGPFANIAHGCNSIIATLTALSLSDYCITEAGFGADLGGEKFFDLKCRLANLNPNAVVIVATVKAFKNHSENKKISEGFANLQKHIENIKNVFNKEVIVAVNKFPDDKQDEIDEIKNLCQNLGISCLECSPFLQGGEGCIELAKEVLKLTSKKPSKLEFCYNLEDSLEEKIEKIVKKIYGASNIEYYPSAQAKIALLNEIAPHYPVIIAKTQYSLSDDMKLIGCPQNFTFHIKDLELKNGAGFIVAIAGNISLMPGLGKNPNSEQMKIDDKGKIFGL